MSVLKDGLGKIGCIIIIWTVHTHITMVSCQKGPTRNAYAWQIGPFWQDTIH